MCLGSWGHGSTSVCVFVCVCARPRVIARVRQIECLKSHGKSCTIGSE